MSKIISKKNILKPCPFCNSKAELMVFNEEYGTVTVCCTNEECDITMGKAFFTDEEAINHWNRRKQDPKKDIEEKLAAYEKAESEGLLLRLPCKVGDTVYEISLVEPYRNPPIREMGVVDILLRDDDMYFTLQDLHDEYYDNSILSTEIGRTVFLTEKEAEQALDKMKGE